MLYTWLSSELPCKHTTTPSAFVLTAVCPAEEKKESTCMARVRGLMQILAEHKGVMPEPRFRWQSPAGLLSDGELPCKIGSFILFFVFFQFRFTSSTLQTLPCLLVLSVSVLSGEQLVRIKVKK